MKWKFAFALMAIAAMLFVFAACQDDGDTPEPAETGRLETVKERGKSHLRQPQRRAWLRVPGLGR